jgi:Protein of unknown function (DUF3500)
MNAIKSITTSTRLNGSIRVTNVILLTSNRRKWSNPEILFNDCGLRLEFLEEKKIDLAMSIVKATLSPVGYQKVRDAMRTNHFLGELVNARPILNEFSYK